MDPPSPSPSERGRPGRPRAARPVWANPAPAGQPDPDMPGVGSVLGKYELVAPLGRGASTVIFRAVHRKLRISVALKLFSLKNFSNAEEVLHSLTSEAVLLAQLNHPNIVRLWDMDDEGPYPYLVTEFIDGHTLGSLIGHYGRLPADFAMALARQAVEGLETAYESGIVHRDIKPNNILIARDGTVKLVDLGLAMITGDPITEGGSFVPHRRDFAGTAAYLAPEQARAPNAVDHRADMYSLGATFYHALTGRMPFEGHSLLQLLHKHLNEAPVPPVELVPEIPVPISDLIVRLLAKDPEERFATYEELRIELSRAVGDRRRRPRGLEEFFYNVKRLPV